MDMAEELYQFETSAQNLTGEWMVFWKRYKKMLRNTLKAR